MTKKFTELDHTADYLYECSGDTPEELFSAAADAMFNILFESVPEKIPDNAEIIHTDPLKSDTLTGLLIDYLSELIYLEDISCLVFLNNEVRITESEKSGNKEYILNADITGIPFDQELYGGGTEIKGISRSGAEIVRKDGIWSVKIIFDI